MTISNKNLDKLLAKARVAYADPELTVDHLKKILSEIGLTGYQESGIYFDNLDISANGLERLALRDGEGFNAPHRHDGSVVPGVKRASKRGTGDGIFDLRPVEASAFRRALGHKEH